MKKRYYCAVLSLFLFLSCFTMGCKKDTADVQAEPVHGKTVDDMIGTEDTPDPIHYNGLSYVLRDDVTSYLFMGIDKDAAEENDGLNNGGQADAIILLVLDSKNKTYTLLQLNRDTICTVDTMGAGNVILNSADMQLCLSHTYGDGGEASNENTVRAVSRLLYDTPVAGYMAIGMDAMSILNDAVGGVTVTLTEDFSDMDPAMTQGTTITLTGDQAYTYLRSRQSVGDGTNLSRMQRHRTYLTAFMDKLQTKLSEDASFLNSLYESVKTYSQTDLSGADFNELISAASGYTNNGIITPDGTTAVVDGLNEFYVNDDDLMEIIISLFYEEYEV